MTGIRLYLFLIPTVFFFSRCDSLQEQAGVKTSLDSLSGSLTALQRMFLPGDSTLIEECLIDFNKRRVWTSSLSGDTLHPDDAMALERFYHSAQQLEANMSNRTLLKERAILLRDQLRSLRLDAGSGSYSLTQLQQHLKREKEACEAYTLILLEQQKTGREALKEFIESRSLVDQLLQRRTQEQTLVVKPLKTHR